MSRVHATTLSRRIWRVWFVVVFAGAAVIGGSPSALAASAWAVARSPVIDADSTLNGVTCVSSSQCWAVGAYVNSAGAVQTLVEAWNGTSWSIVSSPSVAGAAFQGLNSVACASSSACWAVGRAASATRTYLPLIEKWDGTAWSIVTSPDLGDNGAQLFDVTCASTSTCFAVGYQFNSTDAFGRPLIEKWNGTGWSAVQPPTPGMSERLLRGVGCASRSSCWAVGTYFTGNTGVSSTLAERWNGTSWLVVPSPNSSTAEASTLASVSCLTKAKCWTVGSTTESGGGNRNSTLVEKWNGASWSLVPSPNSNQPENFLEGVSCKRRSNCWAVGTAQDAEGASPESLIEQWNGSGWSVVNAPSASGSSASLLADVACQRSGCWAVGTNHDAATNHDQALILHHG